ncbi:MAG: hypothetical protein ACTS4T_00610 [Candidatus Hodgkinia cicadicola]
MYLSLPWYVSKVITIDHCDIVVAGSVASKHFTLKCYYQRSYETSFAKSEMICIIPHVS